MKLFPALGVLVLSVLVSVFLFAWLGELPLHPPPSLPASALSRVPSGDHGSYRLTGVDGAIGPDRRVHVLWRAFDEVRDRDELWYAHSEPGESGWTVPQLLDSSSESSARIVVAASGVHAVVRGRELRHLQAESISGSWWEAAPIGRPGEPHAVFDVAATDSGLVVAYIAWAAPDSEASFERKTVRLVVADLRGGQRAAYREVADFGHLESYQVGGPRVVSYRGQLHVMLVVGPLDTLRLAPGVRPPSGAMQSGAGSPWVVDKNRLIDYHRDSSGAWSGPVELIPAWWGSTPPALAPASTDDRLFVFFQRDGLEGVKSVDGRTWSAARHIADARSPWQADALAASADHDALVVTWIDTRLGWKQHLTWDFNAQTEADVFAIVSQGPGSSLAGLARSPMVRVTPSGRFLHAVTAKSGGGRHELFWITYQATQAPEVGVGWLPAPASDRHP